MERNKISELWVKTTPRSTAQDDYKNCTFPTCSLRMGFSQYPVDAKCQNSRWTQFYGGSCNSLRKSEALKTINQLDFTPKCLIFAHTHTRLLALCSEPPSENFIHESFCFTDFLFCFCWMKGKQEKRSKRLMPNEGRSGKRGLGKFRNDFMNESAASNCHREWTCFMARPGMSLSRSRTSLGIHVSSAWEIN